LEVLCWDFYEASFTKGAIVPEFTVGQTVLCVREGKIRTIKEVPGYGIYRLEDGSIHRGCLKDVSKGLEPEFTVGQRVRDKRDGSIQVIKEILPKYLFESTAVLVGEEHLEAAPVEEVGFMEAMQAFFDGKEIKRTDSSERLSRSRVAALIISEDAMLAKDWIILDEPKT
jgi:hypothetical protein